MHYELPERLDPHTEQKTFTAAPGAGRNTRSSSSPASSRNRSRATRPCVRPNVPECFRQREQ